MNIKMENPVSVIIPCYNSENSIEAAIYSVLNQTYKNIEIIVINDGSTDNSSKLIKQILHKYKSVNLIETQNNGVSMARNTGLKLAKGKYIAFLDADDIYAENYIEVLVTAIENSGCDTAYCRFIRDKSRLIITSNKRTVEDKYTFLKKQMLKRTNRLGFYNYLYIRDKLTENNIQFQTDLKYGEDSVFIMQYLSTCESAVSIDAGLYKYCDNDNSVMHNVSWRMTDNLIGVRRIEKILEGTPLYQEYCNYAFPRAVWALAKDFAWGKNRNLFNKLDMEYDVREYMKKLFFNKTTEKSVKITTMLYFINPQLFYKFMNVYKNIKKNDRVVQ